MKQFKWHSWTDFKTGGTVHIVTNNQVGFTTNYLDARSSTYCTDVAKTTLCPVFHVNADDVEAVVQVMEMAVEYRQHFNSDIFHRFIRDIESMVTTKVMSLSLRNRTCTISLKNIQIHVISTSSN